VNKVERYKGTAPGAGSDEEQKGSGWRDNKTRGRKIIRKCRKCCRLLSFPSEGLGTG
jgi:hypothetical protein